MLKNEQQKLLSCRSNFKYIFEGFILHHEYHHYIWFSCITQGKTKHELQHTCIYDEYLMYLLLQKQLETPARTYSRKTPLHM